jgi:hypothetical protein
MRYVPPPPVPTVITLDDAENELPVSQCSVFSVNFVHVVALIASPLVELVFWSQNTARSPHVVDPVPPRAFVSVPVVPAIIGNPVQFVSVPLDGVPRAGVVSVGEVSVLFVSVCEPVSVTNALGSVSVSEERFTVPLDGVPSSVPWRSPFFSGN